MSLRTTYLAVTVCRFFGVIVVCVSVTAGACLCDLEDCSFSALLQQSFALFIRASKEYANKHRLVTLTGLN